MEQAQGFSIPTLNFMNTTSNLNIISDIYFIFNIKFKSRKLIEKKYSFLSILFLY